VDVKLELSGRCQLRKKPNAGAENRSGKLRELLAPPLNVRCISRCRSALCVRLVGPAAAAAVGVITSNCQLRSD
jgi:hypothetical protein